MLCGSSRSKRKKARKEELLQARTALNEREKETTELRAKLNALPSNAEELFENKLRQREADIASLVADNRQLTDKLDKATIELIKNQKLVEIYCDRNEELKGRCRLSEDENKKLKEKYLDAKLNIQQTINMMDEQGEELNKMKRQLDEYNKSLRDCIESITICKKIKKKRESAAISPWLQSIAEAMTDTSKQIMEVNASLNDVSEQLKTGRNADVPDHVCHLDRILGDDWADLVEPLALSENDVKDIKRRESRGDKYSHILMLWRKSDPDQFFTPLEYCLAVEEFGRNPRTAKPMGKSHKKVLQDNSKYIRENITMKHILPSLESYLLNTESRIYIEKGLTNDEQIQRLIHVLKCSGPAALYAFCKAMEEAEYKFVANKLLANEPITASRRAHYNTL